MSGILKNKDEKPLVSNDTENLADFRKKVLENTRLNAKLTNGSYDNILQKEGVDLKTFHRSTIPKDTVSLKKEKERQKQLLSEKSKEDKEKEEEDLKWNKKNLQDNEIIKQQFKDVHVDEPKTPYQGAIDPNGEYYKVDDEDEVNGSFSLGEPVLPPQSSEAGNTREEEEEIIKVNEDSDEEEDKEAKHRRFEEMRKKHYNLKDALKNKSLGDEDEDEEA
ncbi:related to Protein GLC8 [Saccharomycodes ludwigii]|uniref:Related to Protein GLC8 n=1 Tax=Saccharomycodes ludwigii TaxID=36035 RepID=A0A376B7L4_9ASCO|nr:hypothetical protein SCDLUD_004430 [Saccharomycodes ludwigii]KAH3899009.1 hypothetical protein SCDLUD_004430 [Saccharomycodes ludwigii]SSD60658.1 related to Protein GLC8 [Saccharomycodes ludwigii]